MVKRCENWESLENAKKNRDERQLLLVVKSGCSEIFFTDNEYIFQDYNTPVYNARIMQLCKQNKHNSRYLWLAQSLDANIVENILF